MVDTHWMTLVFDVPSTSDFGGKTRYIAVQISYIIDIGYYVSYTWLCARLISIQGTDQKSVTEEQSFIE